MMLDFAVENYGPFRKCSVLSMCATLASDLDRSIVPNALGDDSLLTSVVIFGPNGSGKTRFFEAFQALADMTSRAFELGGRYRCYSPFRLSSETSEAPVELDIRLVDPEGVLYDYHLSYNGDRIVSEALYHSPNGRRARVFERTVTDEGQTFKGGRGIITSVTNVRTTYLFMAAVHNDPICMKVRGMIRGIRVMGLDGLPPVEEINEYLKRRISEEPEFVSRVLRVMDYADFRISDIVLEGDTMHPGERVMLRHDHPGADGCPLFPLELESSGTLQMLLLAANMTDVLLDGGILVVDDFESLIHSTVAEWILMQFSDRRNPNNAQLIVNTHSPWIMDTDELLRRDQVYFVDKDRNDGSSELFPLTSFKGVRKDTRVRQEYATGRYGAVPVAVNLKVVG